MADAMPLAPSLLKNARSACKRFEEELSAFVDGELSNLDHPRVAVHVEECDSCRGFVNALAGISTLHRDVGAEQFVADLDAGQMWQDLTRRLLTDTRDRVARVLYELGKALIAQGLASDSADVTDTPLYVRRPGSVRVLSRKGQRLAREYSRLQQQVPDRRRRGHELRSKELFPGREPSRNAPALESGRICMEQCLQLDDQCHEARIYLAQYFHRVERYDRARQQLKVLLRLQPPERLRILAVHLLGRIYSAARQFDRASELETEVLEAATRQQEPMIQVGALTNLTIYNVKLGRFDEAEKSIARLVQDFPARLEDEVLPTFRRAKEFRRILLRNEEFLARLRQRYPVLFAG